MPHLLAQPVVVGVFEKHPHFSGSELFGWPATVEPVAESSPLIHQLGIDREAYRMGELLNVNKTWLLTSAACAVLIVATRSPWLSPRTAKIDRSRKMRHYAAAGVRHVWLLDPLATTLEIYRLDGDGWRLVYTHAGETTIRPEPFDAVDFDLGSLWSR